MGQHLRVGRSRSQLRIQERFVSLQGEGLLVGVPSSFVRVSGCNLRCAWCDTPRTSWTPEGDRLDIEEIARWCEEGPRHVVLTGGEPMLFPAIVDLCSLLRWSGHHVTIETAGSVDCEKVEADLMSISPKLSHSTPHQRAEAEGKPKLAIKHERERINLGILDRLLCDYAWQLKFVVRTGSDADLAADLDEIEALLTKLDLPEREFERVLLMPEGTDDASLRAGYLRALEVCQSRGFRLGLRMHIHLFGHTPGT